jgi:carbon storage regulator
MDVKQGIVMLILYRELEQSIIIDGEIKIKVLQLHEQFVRLGFSAPHDIKIVREEIIRNRFHDRYRD